MGQNKLLNPTGRTDRVRLPAMAAAFALLLGAGALAEDAPADYGHAFVDAFAEACVPERLSFPGTKALAETLGWTPAERVAHPELAAMMAIMDAGADEAARDMQGTFDYQLYVKPVAEVDHYLVVSRASFVVDFGDEPDVWTYIGCYLYNFDASAPIDPAPVTALIGNPISRSVDQDGLVSHLWGPPCPMPRTGDSYLTFVAEGSPYAAQTGFSGLMMKFETSEPDPDEVVPETYCTDESEAGSDEGGTYDETDAYSDEYGDDRPDESGDE